MSTLILINDLIQCIERLNHPRTSFVVNPTVLEATRTNKFNASLPTPIIHLKGFGGGIDYTNPTIQKLQTHCIETLYSLLQNGGTLIMDGDSYRDSSFAFLIPIVLTRIFESNKINGSRNPLLLLAFVQQRQTKRFTDAWFNVIQMDANCRPNQFKFLLQPLSDVYNFVDLGVAGMNISQSKLMICFGGGIVLKQEYETISKQYTTDHAIPMFYVYDVNRFNARTQQFDMPSLKAKVVFDETRGKYTNCVDEHNNICFYSAGIEEWSLNCQEPLAYHNQLMIKQYIIPQGTSVFSSVFN
eukprot:1053734_1